MKAIHYAIIGFGVIAENRIAKEGFALDSSRFVAPQSYRLVGATDLNPARRTVAESMGLQWYSSVDAILADSAIDAVYVATNNSTHYPLCRRILEAGKHCMVEKPMATKLDDALELQGLARERALSLGVDHMMVYNSYNVKARQLLRDGALGQVNDLCVHMEFLLGGNEQQKKAWRCADPRELGGPLGDVGSHCLYMAEFLLESTVDSLACAYLPKTLGLSVEEGALVQFTTRSGIGGTARVAFNQPRGNDEGTFLNMGFEVYGTRAVLRSYGTMFQLSGHADEPVDLRLEIDRYKALEPIRLQEVRNIYQESILRHARSISDGQPLDASDALHNLRLVLACHESANQGGKTIAV